MNMNTQVSTQHPKPNLISRLTNRLVAGQYRMALKSLQMDAADSLADLIAEADPALDTAISGEIERLLRTGGAPFVRFDETLMPKMRARFGGDHWPAGCPGSERAGGYEEALQLMLGSRAMLEGLRGGESAEQCAEFCPNARIFEALATGLRQISR